MASTIPLEEVAAITRLSVRRVSQLIEEGRLPAHQKDRKWYVSEETAEALRIEQSCITSDEVCKRLSISRRELGLAIEKGILIPRNLISKLNRFDPEEVMECHQAVTASVSIKDAAEQLGWSMRTTYRKIKAGALAVVETVHGTRVPLEEIATQLQKNN